MEDVNEKCCPYCGAHLHDDDVYISEEGKTVKSEIVNFDWSTMTMRETVEVYNVRCCRNCLKRREVIDKVRSYFVMIAVCLLIGTIILSFIGDFFDYSFAVYIGSAVILFLLSLLNMWLLPHIMNLSRHHKYKVSYKRAMKYGALIAPNQKLVDFFNQ